jgi:dimeric dUTPase (all-alpha-NTP-PPase superfamily)
MNVNDVSEKPNTGGKYFEFIISHQKQLMQTYHKIEEKSGIGYALVVKVPFSIDEKRWQYLFKDFAWRVVEEIAEALEAFTAMQVSIVKEGFYTHLVEELIDSLHFYSELLIISGIDTVEKVSEILTENSSGIKEPLGFFWKQPPYSMENSLSVYCNKVIQFLGMAMNCLKQKPWKQTQMLTDQMKYKRNLLYGYWFLIGTLKVVGLDPEQITNFYFSKNQVNQFRQRSNY